MKLLKELLTELLALLNGQTVTAAPAAKKAKPAPADEPEDDPADDPADEPDGEKTTIPELVKTKDMIAFFKTVPGFKLVGDVKAAYLALVAAVKGDVDDVPTGDLKNLAQGFGLKRKKSAEDQMAELADKLDEFAVEGADEPADEPEDEEPADEPEDEEPADEPEDEEPADEEPEDDPADAEDGPSAEEAFEEASADIDFAAVAKDELPNVKKWLKGGAKTKDGKAILAKVQKLLDTKKVDAAMKEYYRAFFGMVDGEYGFQDFDTPCTVGSGESAEVKCNGLPMTEEDAEKGICSCAQTGNRYRASVDEDTGTVSFTALKKK